MIANQIADRSLRTWISQTVKIWKPTHIDDVFLILRLILDHVFLEAADNWILW